MQSLTTKKVTKLKFVEKIKNRTQLFILNDGIYFVFWRTKRENYSTKEDGDKGGSGDLKTDASPKHLHLLLTIIE